MLEHSSSLMYRSRIIANILVLFASLSSRYGLSAISTGTTYPPQLHGVERDPFVQNAPLVIAVACRNGVAVIAATEPTSPSSSSTSNIVPQQHDPQTSHHYSSVDSEPLLYYNANDIREIYLRSSNMSSINSTTTTAVHNDHSSQSDSNDNSAGYSFMDLPDTFAGPYRIQSITNGMIMACCGWKVDGYIQLLNAAREIVESERYEFGTTDDDEGSVNLVANQLSLYMAQCAVSERLRTLSCTALIGGINNKYGCVWFVDVTGAYPVRGHCMGGGTVSVPVGKHTEGNVKTVQFADHINQELLRQFRLRNNNDTSKSLSYFDMTTDEALIMILDLLCMQTETLSRLPTATKPGTLIPSKTRLELVHLTSSSHSNNMKHRPRRRMIRKRISDLWGMKKWNSVLQMM